MPSTRGFEPTTLRSRGECPTTALQPQPNYRTLVWLGLRWLSVFEPMTSLQPTPRRPAKQRPKLVQKSPLGWLVWHVKIILNETGQLSMKRFLLLQSLPFSSHTSSAILFPFQLAAATTTTTTTTATFTTSKVFFQHTKEHIFSSSSLFHWRHKHKISRNSLSLYCWMFFHRQNNLDVVHITSQHFNTVRRMPRSSWREVCQWPIGKRWKMMETGIANLGGGSSRQSTEVTKEIRSRQSDLCAVKMQRRKSFLSETLIWLQWSLVSDTKEKFLMNHIGWGQHGSWVF